MIDLKKPREFIEVNSKVKKTILFVVVVGMLYVGIMFASQQLNNFLFKVYNVDTSFLVQGR